MSHSRGGMVDALSPSTVISQSIQNGSVCLNGRSCTASLNLLPGTIALVVCLVGVIALNILGYHYLSLCFVAGGIASGYTIYQGYKMRLLKTLEKSNHELKEHIEELWKNISGLREENNKLGGVLSEFERVNSELEKLIGVKKEENSMLCGENRSLKSLVVEQKELILRLEEDIRELNEIRLTLEQNMESHTESLTLLVSSLSGIQESASKDHKSFSTNLERLEGLLSKLPCLSENASERVVSFERLRNSQFLGLQKAIAALQEIFSIINEWKDTEAVSRTIESLQKLQKQQFKLNEDIRGLCFEIGQKKGTLIALKQEIEELRELETKFRSALGILKIEVEGVGGHVEAIHEATEILKQAQKPITLVAQKIKESKVDEKLFALKLIETV